MAREIHDPGQTERNLPHLPVPRKVKIASATTQKPLNPGSLGWAPEEENMLWLSYNHVCFCLTSSAPLHHRRAQVSPGDYPRFYHIMIHACICEYIYTDSIMSHRFRFRPQLKIRGCCNMKPPFPSGAPIKRSDAVYWTVVFLGIPEMRCSVAVLNMKCNDAGLKEFLCWLLHFSALSA